jgi:carboxymethylenebutenolidase
MIAGRGTYPSRGVDRPAYVARPDDAPRPGVVVIHEIFGLSAHMEDVCRRFAVEGYAAMAPDLFAHGGRPVTDEELEAAMRFTQSLPPEIRRDAAAARERLSQLPEPHRTPTARALDWLQHRDFDGYVPDLEAAVGWLGSQRFARRDRIGAVGFCMGGALAARLAAAGAPLAACVIFYGNNPPLDRVPNIRGPVLGLYGGDDKKITDAVPEFADAMKRAGKRFEHHVYPGAGHAFFNDTRQEVFRKDAAEDAWRRVLAFFEATLRA